MIVALVVQSSQLPFLPPWLLACGLLAFAICFAPQSARRPIPRFVICAVVLAIAFGAVGYAVVYQPPDWCALSAAHPDDWFLWLQCKVS